MTRIRESASPRISVVMSVCNEAAWVGESMESILCQTCGDFEFLVTDDGSRDDSYRILKRYLSRDGRIRILRHRTRKGLAASLNEQIRLARGRYIARMDGDDVSHPDRLARQAAFLDRHPGVGLLGTWCREIDSKGAVLGTWHRPTTNYALQKALLRCNPFIHSSVMLRREVFERVGLYRPVWKYAQDYDLWLRVSRHFHLANLPEPLVDLRVDWKKMARKNRAARRCEMKILVHYICSGGRPWWYRAYLFRPLLLYMVPTPCMMTFKLLQRRLRRQGKPGRGRPVPGRF